jgi:hypothetical protein
LVHVSEREGLDAIALTAGNIGGVVHIFEFNFVFVETYWYDNTDCTFLRSFPYIPHYYIDGKAASGFSVSVLLLE